MAVLAMFQKSKGVQSQLLSLVELKSPRPHTFRRLLKISKIVLNPAAPWNKTEIEMPSRFQLFVTSFHNCSWNTLQYGFHIIELIVNVYQRVGKPNPITYIKETIQMNRLNSLFSILKCVYEFDSKKVIFEVFL